MKAQEEEEAVGAPILLVKGGGMSSYFDIPKPLFQLPIKFGSKCSTFVTRFNSRRPRRSEAAKRNYSAASLTNSWKRFHFPAHIKKSTSPDGDAKGQCISDEILTYQMRAPLRISKNKPTRPGQTKSPTSRHEIPIGSSGRPSRNCESELQIPLAKREKRNSITKFHNQTS